MGYYEQLDLSNDLLLMWGLGSGTLKVEGQHDVSLDECILDEPIDTREMEPSDGQVPQMDTLKIWPTSKSAKPPLGSVIVDSSGTYWTILSIRFKHLLNTWEAHCRNLSILPSTTNTTRVLKAKFVKGRANEAKAEWYGLFSGVRNGNADDDMPCRLQLVAEEAVIRFGSEWVKQTYRCIMEKAIPVDMTGGEYRLIDAQGNHYRIIQSYEKERIDKLPIVVCLRIIEGEEYAGQPSPLTPPPFPSSQSSS